MGLEQYHDVLLLATAVVAVLLLLDSMSVITLKSKDGFSAKSNYLNMLETSGGTVYQRNRV